MVFLVVLKSPIANQYGVKMSETKFIKAGIVIDSWKSPVKVITRSVGSSPIIPGSLFLNRLIILSLNGG